MITDYTAAMTELTIDQRDILNKIQELQYRRARVIARGESPGQPPGSVRYPALQSSHDEAMLGLLVEAGLLGVPGSEIFAAAHKGTTRVIDTTEPFREPVVSRDILSPNADILEVVLLAHAQFRELLEDRKASLALKERGRKTLCDAFVAAIDAGYTADSILDAVEKDVRLHFKVEPNRSR
jgi:hypothetical protein